MASESGLYDFQLRDCEIRILTLLPGDLSSPIVCSLTGASLKDSPKYGALSYVWGDPSDTGPVTIDGKTVDLTANLKSALRYLRSTTQPMKLWIDAVCINQGDHEERSTQVSMMGTIYSSARTVYIWIGEADDLSDTAYPLMPAVAEGKADEQAKDKTCSFYLSLTQRSWFSRIWIMQELALAKADPVVVCGERQISWRTFMSAWKVLARTLFAEFGWTRQLSDAGGVEVLGSIKIDVLDDLRSNVHRDKGQSLRQLLLQSRTSECTDAKDRIYGLLGMLDDEDRGPYPVIDYRKSASTIFSEAVAHLFSKGLGPTFLGGMWLPGISPQLPGLPSWALDFSRQTGEKANTVWCIDFHPPHPYTVSGPGADAINGAVLKDLLTLKVEALPVDIVSEVIRLPADFPGCLLQLKHIHQLAETCRSRSIAGDSNASLLETFKASEPLWRTLVSNKACMSGYDVAPDQYEAMFAELVTYCHGLQQSDAEVAGSAIPDNDLVNALKSHLPDHAFFSTVKGFVGMASKDILMGDEIAIWFGATIPFITRDMAADPDYCQLVSGAYVGGIMQGQMVDELYCEDLADSKTLLVR